MSSWNFFDAIFCINLEKEIEKRKECVQIFNNFEIPVTFFKGIKDDISNKGCLESHKAIYNLALQKGYKKIVIFEDDIVPTKPPNSINLEYCIDFMKKYNWDIFYFGAVPSIFNYFQEKSPVKNIYKIKGICTHAYALNKSALEKLRNIQWNPKNPLDYAIRDNDSLEKYAIYPSFFNQQTKYKIPTTLKNLGFSTIEGYAYYIQTPLSHVLLIILFIFLILFLIFKIKNKSKYNSSLRFAS